MKDGYRKARCCGTCRYLDGAWCEPTQCIPNEYAVCDYYQEKIEQ